jgi:hypothetical protein
VQELALNALELPANVQLCRVQVDRAPREAKHFTLLASGRYLRFRLLSRLRPN